jgi:hypothetical protein
MEAIFAALFMLALFFGPLIARIRVDRQADRANALAADLRAAVRRRLGGDSMVSVEVSASSPWRAGRVRLSAPSAYLDLIEKVWPTVTGRLPAGYELVVPAAPVTRLPTPAAPRHLPRAA